MIYRFPEVTDRIGQTVIGYDICYSNDSVYVNTYIYKQPQSMNNKELILSHKSNNVVDAINYIRKSCFDPKIEHKLQSAHPFPHISVAPCDGCLSAVSFWADAIGISHKELSDGYAIIKFGNNCDLKLPDGTDFQCEDINSALMQANLHFANSKKINVILKQLNKLNNIKTRRRIYNYNVQMSGKSVELLNNSGELINIYPNRITAAIAICSEIEAEKFFSFEIKTKSVSKQMAMS